MGIKNSFNFLYSLALAGHRPVVPFTLMTVSSLSTGRGVTRSPGVLRERGEEGNHHEEDHK